MIVDTASYTIIATKKLCNTLRERIKGEFCATNLMLHSFLLLWNAVANELSAHLAVQHLECADNSLRHSKIVLFPLIYTYQFLYIPDPTAFDCG